MAPPLKPFEDFTLAVICPLEMEALAMLRQLDEDKHYGSVFSDDCSFRLGGIGEHNIVITSLPGGRTGNSSATVAGQQTRATFPNIQSILLVGIAGGVPSDKNDIRLGDVVVSFPTGKYGGVIQYDFGKEEEEFKRYGQTNSVPQKLLAYLDSIRLTHGLSNQKTPKYVQYLKAQIAAGRLVKPDSKTDRLFPATYFHQGGSDCTSCDEKQIKLREAREQPQIHYGLIASGNRVMKNSQQRDQCNQDHDGMVLAYEMEAAGLMNFTPCLVIRGISDYSDSHKSQGKIWHAFAAAVSASYAREFIEEVPIETVKTDLGGQIVERKAHWNVPFGRNKDFIGRESELQYLMAGLDPKHEDDCQRVAISGLGGIGKTQIALEAAFRIKEVFACSVFWVPAVDAASFEYAYRDIGQKLEIPGINDNKADMKSLVKGFLSCEDIGRWLMIIDNADDLEMLFDRADENDERLSSLPLVDYLPYSQRGSILFTTRNSKVAVKYAGTNFIAVKEMSEKESKELFEISLVDKSLTRDEDVSKLLDLLSNLPLAIKQAAAFLNENGMSISEYVGIYETSNEELVELLSENFEDKGRYQNTKNPVALTWLISFRHIERSDKLAAEYLYFISCVAQQDIPRSLLPLASKLREGKAIGTLKAYSFITEHIGYRSYSIHPLVQVTVRNWLKKESSLSSWCLRTLNRLAEAFPFFEHEKKDECTLLLPHTQYVLEFQRLSKDSGESSRKLLFNIGEYFLQTGEYYEATKMFQRTLELRKKVLGPKHPDTLLSMNKLADVLFRQGSYKESENMHRQTIRLREKVLGFEHPDTLLSMNHLGNLFNRQGKYEEAEIIHQRTLGLREKVLGPEHPDTLMSRNNLAAVLERQGRYDEAGNMHRQTMELREKILGPEHPDTLGSMNNLANVLSWQGKYEGAENINRQTLGLRQKVLGPKHPDTLLSMNNLASVLDEQEKYKEAETIYRPTVELREKVLGPEHPDTLMSIGNLAYVLDRQGKYEEAEVIHRRTTRLTKKLLGPENPDTLNSMNNLAMVLVSQGKYKEAETLHRQTIELREKVLGPEHPVTLMSINNLANVLSWQEKYKEAETLHRRTLELRQKVLGPDHPDTFLSLKGLDSVLNSQIKYDDDNGEKA